MIENKCAGCKTYEKIKRAVKEGNISYLGHLFNSWCHTCTRSDYDFRDRYNEQS